MVLLRSLLAALAPLLATAVLGQPSSGHLVRGTVRDATTGEELPATTVQVAGTYRGTIANDAGEYLLEISELSATLVATRIGYASQERTVADTTVHEVSFDLDVSPYVLPELVVTPNLARDVMRRVIEAKQVWQPRVEDYLANAYTRRTISRGEDIVLMSEVVSEITWDREHGQRETITSTRETRNFEASDEGLSALEGVFNLYDDDIQLVEHELIGLTHPDALDHYRYRLAGRRVVDDRVVYDIDVEAATMQPAFEGRVAVLDGDFALLEADVRPSRNTMATLLPVPLFEHLELHVQQQFRGHDGIWLPADYRLRIDVTLGMVGLHFPPMVVEQATRFADYRVNTELPDSVVARTARVVVDSAAVEADSTFTRFGDPVPLTEKEQAALDTITPQYTPDKVLRPTGFLTRFMDDEDDEPDPDPAPAAADTDTDTTSADAGGPSLVSRLDLHPAFRFNRVEAAQLALRREARGPAGLWLRGSAGFSSGLERVSAEASVSRRVKGGRGSAFAEASVRRGAASHYGSEVYPLLLNTVQVLVAEDDYFDYYWVEGYGLGVGGQLRRGRLQARLDWRDEKHRSLASQTDFDLLGRTDGLRPNPTVDEGRMRRLDLQLSVGANATTFGLEGPRAAVSASYSDGWMGSDFDYASIHGQATWRQPTFLRRRFIPNTLSVKLVGGAHTGDLPVQRFGILDVALGPLSPFGVLRGERGHPYVGESYAAMFWEHDFRTTPFEILRLWPLVKRGFGASVHGASGQTWISRSTRAALPLKPRWARKRHDEVGASLQFYFFGKVDVTRRLDTDGWFVGVSVAPLEY